VSEASEIEKKLSGPNTKAGRLQRHVLKLYSEHARDGALPTSGRFLFYELETRGIVQKKYYDGAGNERPRKPYQDVWDALTRLREEGLVLWEDIVDETRTLDVWPYRASVAEYVEAAAETARIDLWRGEKPPLILCESRSLGGVLRPIAQDYLCPIASTNGQTGGFLHSEVAPLIEGGRRVFYLGDYDLSGDHIEANTRQVLSEYGALDWEKVAITGVQVREGGFEADAVIKTDNRYKPARRFLAVETERLKQVPLTRILRARLDAELPEPLADMLQREENQRVQVQVREALDKLLDDEDDTAAE
jgi:hypothetical protein